MFYEDESEEMGNSNAGGFNIGLADEAQEENNQWIIKVNLNMHKIMIL